MDSLMETFMLAVEDILIMSFYFTNRVRLHWKKFGHVPRAHLYNWCVAPYGKTFSVWCGNDLSTHNCRDWA